jgi:hypothetical protein
MTERVRPQTTRSATARGPKVTITGKTYTLVGDWPRSQSSAQTAVDLTIDVVRRRPRSFAGRDDALSSCAHSGEKRSIPGVRQDMRTSFRML